MITRVNIVKNIIQALLLLASSNLFAQFSFTEFPLNPAAPSKRSLGSNFGALSEKSFLLCESQSAIFPIEGERIRFSGLISKPQRSANYRAHLQSSNYANIPSYSFGIAYLKGFHKFQFASQFEYNLTLPGDYYGLYKSFQSKLQVNWEYKNIHFALQYGYAAGFQEKELESSQWKLGLHTPISNSLSFGSFIELRPKSDLSFFWLSMAKEINKKIVLEFRFNQQAHFGFGGSLHNAHWQFRLFIQYHPYLALQPYAVSSYSF